MYGNRERSDLLLKATFNLTPLQSVRHVLKACCVFLLGLLPLSIRILMSVYPVTLNFNQGVTLLHRKIARR